jgi:diaminopimelate epimerase
MSINYTKMNSQGNDFIIIDVATEVFEDTQENITKMCSRENIGCDQLLLINTSNPDKVACKIYNSDGTSACQCGNGLRAIMLYLNKKFSITESIIKVCGKHYNAQIVDRNKISVDLGKPIFEEMKVEESVYCGEIVDVGNKHFVIIDDGDIDGEIYSKDLDHHSEKLNKLQAKYNLTFILEDSWVLDENNFLRIKVKERGAGWTKSCGSGAIAAAAYAIKHNKPVDSPIIVEQDGGALEVHLDDSGSLKLVGPSEFEYDGVWDG